MKEGRCKRYLITVARVAEGAEADVGARHHYHRLYPYRLEAFRILHLVLDGQSQADAFKGVDGHPDEDGHRRRNIALHIWT